MMNILRSVFPLLDIAPLSWAGLFLFPVLIVAVVVLAVVVLVQTIRERKRERAQQQAKDTSGTEQNKGSGE